MTDHASLLRVIRKDARPYVEQALDLAEVFTGFRKLASENGLDWGVIKALIKAEVQDEKEGGTLKVDKIIEKADFASAYADMLGLGASKMNENNFSSEQTGPDNSWAQHPTDAFIDELQAISDGDPPHDSDGVIIEECDLQLPSEEVDARSTGEALASNADASPALSKETAPVSGDAVGAPVRPVVSSASFIPSPQGVASEEGGAASVQSSSSYNSQSVAAPNLQRLGRLSLPVPRTGSRPPPLDRSA